MRKLCFLAVLFLTVVEVGAAEGPRAQADENPDENSESSEVFSETLEIQAVDVQAVVTDRAGRPAAGLSAQDFRVLLDGQPVPLEFFAEVREGRILSLPDGAPLPAGLSEAVQGQPVGNSYLVFIDELFSSVPLRNQALRALAGQVESLGPNDQMAVVTFNGERLAVLTDWTRSRDGLRRVLEGAARNKGSIATAALPLNTGALGSLRLLEYHPSRYPDPNGEGIEESEFKVLTELGRVQEASRAAATALRAFTDAPGRKVLLLLSAGWASDRLATAAAGWEHTNRWSSFRNGEGLALLRPLTDTANQLGFTIYPVQLFDPARYLADATLAADSPSLRAGRNQIVALSQISLAFVAKETGGKLLLPGRNDHLPRIAADTGSYYWLGLTQAGSDGRRRELKVEVLRPGLQVRSRNSSLPLDRRTRLALEAEGALWSGKKLGEVPLEAALGNPRRAGAKTAEVPLAVEIPTDQIALVEQDGRYVGRLELRVAALDEEGRQSPIPVIPIDISGERPPARGGSLVYRTLLKVRNVKQDLQVVLHDTLSGTSSAARLRIEPGRKGVR